MKDYENICQYIPGKHGSKFPEPALKMMIADRIGVPVSSLEDIPQNQIISTLNL
jgi:hypothetical protein